MECKSCHYGHGDNDADFFDLMLLQYGAISQSNSRNIQTELDGCMFIVYLYNLKHDISESPFAEELGIQNRDSSNKSQFVICLGSFISIVQ